MVKLSFISSWRKSSIGGLLLVLLLLATLSTACTLSLMDLPSGFGVTPTPTLPYAIPPTPTPLPLAEITFKVQVPEETPANEPVFLTVLDEVTGLTFNPRPLKMQRSGSNMFELTTQIPTGSVVKYRYTRQSPPGIVEHTTDGRPVRYRLYHAQGQAVVEDIVSRWSDTLFSGPFGRLLGQVTDRETGKPVPNILVSAGGQQTLSASDGSFLLEGLPVGKHNLVAYALDGAYRSFQQEAIIAENATTPAPLALSPAPLVDVSFTVIVPPDTIPGVPIRIAGNLTQLGNTFADLAGGLSTLTNAMPELTPLPDGRFTLTLALPAGADVRYKYTLGDGFWNAEHLPEGAFRVRQLIVPETSQQVEDVVATWRAGNSAPIWFDVTVPEDTPLGDTVAIQFNPFGWTQPLPMWRLEEYRWAYLLSSPLDILGTIGYRYCRNEQCGVADDALTPGDQSGGRPVSTSLLPQNIRDQINQWAWMERDPGPVTVPGGEIKGRGTGFVAGVELQEMFHPTWVPRIPETVATINGLGANWLFITPSWTFIRQSPPVLQPVPGDDALWPDMVDMISQARTQGLEVALRPVAHFPFESAEWWAMAERDFPWWEAWFDRYRTFALHHADLAAQQDARMLVLGGGWLEPALPGGTLADGSPSGVPADAEQRWRDLLAEVRTRYGGTLAWALKYSDHLEFPPPFLDEVDQIHILWYASLAERPDATESELAEEAVRRLDSEVLPLLAEFDKPVVLSIAYPSADGGITGCLEDRRGECLDPAALGLPNPDIPNAALDLNEQVEVYNALLATVNGRDWIEGFVARGFYPPAVLRDMSTSINGKPAADALSYWFPRLLGP